MAGPDGRAAHQRPGRHRRHPDSYCCRPTASPTTGMPGITRADPTRVAAQIVSGIGFLGAGVILRDGLTVRRLNTATTLWCSAAVGR
jgi:hypothetical protein